MTIEDEVRAIIKNVMPFTDHKAKDEAVAALMRLMKAESNEASIVKSEQLLERDDQIEDSCAQLERQIREMPLIARLQMAQAMIGSMCVTRRPPKMSIPVSARDEDVFICTTIRDAMEALQDYQISLETRGQEMP